MVSKLKLVFGLCSLMSTIGSRVGSAAEPVPHSMASMGDSITAGAIADYSLESWKKPSHIYTLLKKLADLASSKNLEAVERKDLSWSAGHAKKIKAKLAARGEEWTFEHWNGAVSGHATNDIINDQLPRLLEWSRKHLNQGAPDYVTLLIGPNDICNKDIEKMTETSVFQSRVQKTIETLLNANSEVKILISELPDVERVWRIARDHKLSNINGARTCSDVWKRMPFCANLLTISDPKDRMRMRQRAEDYNISLDALDAKFQKIAPDQVRVAKGIYDSKFELSALSADCFHPNIKGQNMLSDTTWAYSWWNE